MNILFLGTSSMTPTKERAQSTVLLRHSGMSFLLDCGENMQRQMRIAGVPVPQLTALFITHWHGDHVLGLPGIFENLGKWAHEKKIALFGPQGSRGRVEKIMDAFGLHGKLEVQVTEITQDGLVYEGSDLIVEATALSHSVPCLGYSFREPERRRIKLAAVKKIGIPRGPLLGTLQRGIDITFEGKKVRADTVTEIVPGKKVVYLTDTLYCKQAVRLAKQADVLICEATYGEEHAEIAREHYHMTAREAARIAKEAGAKRLFLTHFSQRYKDVTHLEKEAKKVFKNVSCASDFLKVEL